jgi:hypothetical protein
LIRTSTQSASLKNYIDGATSSFKVGLVSDAFGLVCIIVPTTLYGTEEFEYYAVDSTPSFRMRYAKVIITVCR